MWFGISTQLRVKTLHYIETDSDLFRSFLNLFRSFLRFELVTIACFLNEIRIPLNCVIMTLASYVTISTFYAVTNNTES